MDEVKDLRLRLVNAIRIIDQVEVIPRDARGISPALAKPLIENQKALREAIEAWQRKIDGREER